MVGVYIACAFVLGLGARALGMPPLVGFLAAGFALDAAGLAAPGGLEAIAHAGVLLMLFTVGMKVRLRNIVRAEVWGTALLHLAVSTALLAILIVHGLGTGWVAALLVAVALGFSSTVVVAKSLDEKRELRAFHGRVAIGILIVQDLVAIAVLGLSQGTAPSPWAVALLALLPARRLVHRLLDVAGHGEILLLLGIGLALAGGYGFEALGLSGELGALVLGALLADHPKAQELADTLWGLKEAFLVGFFLLIGMSGLPGHEAFVLALVALALLPLKGALFYGLLVGFKLRARSGVLAGLALANYSEFGLIVVQAAAVRGLLPESWVVALAITVALSFAVSAPLNRASHAILRAALAACHAPRAPATASGRRADLDRRGRRHDLRHGPGGTRRLRTTQGAGDAGGGPRLRSGRGRAASRRGKARGVRRRRGRGPVAPPAPGGPERGAARGARHRCEAVRDPRDSPRRISGAPERDQRIPRGSRRSPRLRVHQHLQLLRAGGRGVRGRGLGGVGEG